MPILGCASLEYKLVIGPCVAQFYEKTYKINA